MIAALSQVFGCSGQADKPLDVSGDVFQVDMSGDVYMYDPSDGDVMLSRI